MQTCFCRIFIDCLYRVAISGNENCGCDVEYGKLAETGTKPLFVIRKAMPRILVIEDEANIARAVRDKLTKDGYTAESVQSGSKALDYLKSQIPDLIILDVLMPDMDGFEVVRRLKQDPNTAKIPVMLLTVLPQDEQIQKMDVDAYLTKPYRGADLIRTVREVLTKFKGDKNGE